MKVAIKCKCCEKVFEVLESRLKWKNVKFCSLECRKTYKPTIILQKKECVYCGKELQRKNFATNTPVCGLDCLNKAINTGKVNHSLQKPDRKFRRHISHCKVCNSEYMRKKQQSSHCSRACFLISHKEEMKGENNPSYKNGSSYSKRHYRGDDWHIIRMEVYQRDGFKCQKCGIHCEKKQIQAHHIIPYKYTKNNLLENLITLCNSCHAEIHGNPELFPDFIKIPK